MISALYVLYDEDCGFCSRCAQWLRHQRAHLWLETIPRRSRRAAELFPTLPPIAEGELTVVDDQGGVYYGSNAWILTLWGLQEWRPWARRLATPALRPLARDIFELVSHNRATISAILGMRSDAAVARAVREQLPAGLHKRCDGACGCETGPAAGLSG